MGRLCLCRTRFFRWLIGTIQDISWGAGATPLDKIMSAPWYQRMLIPAGGGLLVGLIVKFLAPEAKGHGVPEVMESMAIRGGKIRARVVLIKAFASSICLGSGGSAGREGPIVQIGSAAGSAAGQWLGLKSHMVKTLVGCGAAGGIAATFNTPIAGVIFAIEIILLEFKTFLRERLMPTPEGYLEKPIEPAAFMQVVKRILEGERALKFESGQ